MEIWMFMSRGEGRWVKKHKTGISLGGGKIEVIFLALCFQVQRNCKSDGTPFVHKTDPVSWI
jgi:hypothetical protein